MVAPNVQDLYDRHVRPLSPDARLRLVELIAKDMAAEAADARNRPKRSLLELEGVGKELWQGKDAQQYVNELRSEWDHRP